MRSAPLYRTQPFPLPLAPRIPRYRDTCDTFQSPHQQASPSHLLPCPKLSTLRCRAPLPATQSPNLFFLLARLRALSIPLLSQCFVLCTLLVSLWQISLPTCSLLLSLSAPASSRYPWLLSYTDSKNLPLNDPTEQSWCQVRHFENGSIQKHL